MATRSGAVSTSDVGRLQEARRSLELELKLPVASSIGKDLRLLVACKDDDDIKRVPGTWSGFPVEARPQPQPYNKGPGKKK